MNHDGLGRREQLGNNVGSLSWTNYLYDGITPVQEQSSSGSKADSLTMPGSGEVLARTDSSGTVAPIYDGTGSPVWLVNSAGAIATQYMYEAYGKPTAALTASSNPFQFTGRELDPSGLYFMRNRYYSPTLSRFVSSDPAGFGGGDLNLFRYAGGDPVNSSDPLGTFVVGVGVSGIACCTVADVSDFGVGGISFDFSQLGVALAGQGLTLAVNSGAGLTGGGGTGKVDSSGGVPGGSDFGPDVGLDDGLSVGGGGTQLARLTAKLPPGTSPEDLDVFGPDLEIGPMIGMAGKLQGRTARRAEQRLVRELAREFGLNTPERQAILHDMLEWAKAEGVEGWNALRAFVKEHLSVFY